MGVPKGTTPTLTLQFSDDNLDLTQAEHVYVTLAVLGNAVTKADDDLETEAQRIKVFLTQEETLSFPVGMIKIQANWVYSNGNRGASDIAQFMFTPQLLGSVLP